MELQYSKKYNSFKKTVYIKKNLMCKIDKNQVLYKWASGKVFQMQLLQFKI